MQIFEVVRNGSENPVTVFADTLEEARRIYADWIDAHDPTRPRLPVMIYPYNEGWFEDRPVMAAAAKLNQRGVGYWSSTEGRWVIGAPGDTPLGDLVRHEPNVSYYRIEAEDGEDAMVFGVSFEHATTLYCAYQLDQWGELPKRYSLRKMSRWDLRGEMVTLRDDMEADLAGVGMRDVHGVWRILPPDWEPPIGR